MKGNWREACLRFVYLGHYRTYHKPYRQRNSKKVQICHLVYYCECLHVELRSSGTSCSS